MAVLKLNLKMFKRFGAYAKVVLLGFPKKAKIYQLGSKRYGTKHQSPNGNTFETICILKPRITELLTKNSFTTSASGSLKMFTFLPFILES